MRVENSHESREGGYLVGVSWGFKISSLTRKDQRILRTRRGSSKTRATGCQIRQNLGECSYQEDLTWWRKKSKSLSSPCRPTYCEGRFIQLLGRSDIYNRGWAGASVGRGGDWVQPWWQLDHSEIMALWRLHLNPQLFMTWLSLGEWFLALVVLTFKTFTSWLLACWRLRKVKL